MECKQVAQQLPWFLNGTLDDHNRQAIQAHLNHCAQCREALEETVFAGQVYSSHIPVSVLLQVASGGDVAGWDSNAIQTHLSTCADCDAEFSLAKKSYQALEAQSNKPPWWSFRFPGAKEKLLVAALLVAFFGMVLFEVGTRLNPLKDPGDPGGAEFKIPPIINYRNIDLFPVDSPLRSSGSPSLRLGQNTPAISLTLHLRNHGDDGPYLLIVGDSEGNPVLQEEVIPHEDGTVTLLLGKQYLTHEKLVVDLFIDGHTEAFQRFELILPKEN